LPGPYYGGQHEDVRGLVLDLTGTWKLVAWRRIVDDGTVSYPLGEDAHGLLVYTDNGHMIVQLAAANRPPLDTTDALGGDVQERADAYSSCLAYFGSYEVDGDTVIHRIDSSLYPNWSGAEQSRPFTYDGRELVLRTPPVSGPNGTAVNEIAWAREDG
jgi:lipocalin-like protein